MATTKDKVSRYLTGNPRQPFCDFCLMKAVGARERQIVQRATSQLDRDQSANFKRRKILCSNSNQPGHRTTAKLCIAYFGSGPGVPPSK